MRRSQIIMGTGVSVDIPGASQEVFDDVFELIKKVDTKFSTYKKNSETSKYRRGEIKEANLSPEMKDVIKACLKFEKLTDGYFSAWYDGKFDSNSYVKGWAIEEAGKLIKKAGHKNYCIGIGGDILAGSDGTKTWNIGLQDPRNKKHLTSQVVLKDGAVATSGNYERGEHIYNPKTNNPSKELLSLTVTGPDIITADVLATAMFAGGKDALSLIEEFDGYEFFCITSDEHAIMTPGMAELMT